MVIVDLLDQAEPSVIGSYASETDASWDERAHNKWIKRRFAIGSTEVSVEQFTRFVNESPNASFALGGSQSDQQAQTRVNWYHAARYCNWLSKKTGIPPEQWCYEIVDDEKSGPQFKLAENYLSRVGYRLPTEAEWEYCCRAGSQQARPFGDSVNRVSKYGWFDGNSNNQVHGVGELKPNELGLFDMLGNAREWCLEKWSGKLTRIRTFRNNDHEDSLTINRNNTRITKGGSFAELAVKLRSANRIGTHPYLRLETIGFRVARTLPEPADTDIAEN